MDALSPASVLVGSHQFERVVAFGQQDEGGLVNALGQIVPLGVDRAEPVGIGDFVGMQIVEGRELYLDVDSIMTDVKLLAVYAYDLSDAVDGD